MGDVIRRPPPAATAGRNPQSRARRTPGPPSFPGPNRTATACVRPAAHPFIEGGSSVRALRVKLAVGVAVLGAAGVGTAAVAGDRGGFRADLTGYEEVPAI